MTALTRDGIAALDGVALSEAVAEHVMGWGRVANTTKLWGEYLSPSRCIAEHGNGFPEFRPDVDLNHAYEVMAKCCERWPGWEWMIVQEGGSWNVYLTDEVEYCTPENSYNCVNTSLCIAICRTALLAALEVGQR